MLISQIVDEIGRNKKDLSDFGNLTGPVMLKVIKFT